MSELKKVFTIKNVFQLLSGIDPGSFTEVIKLGASILKGTYLSFSRLLQRQWFLGVIRFGTG